MLLEPHVRLLTLLGSPGVGKTHLAREVVAQLLAEFAHEVFFVPLVALADPGLVASAIAQAIGVQEFGGQPLAEPPGGNGLLHPETEQG